MTTSLVAGDKSSLSFPQKSNHSFRESYWETPEGHNSKCCKGPKCFLRSTLEEYYKVSDKYQTGFWLKCSGQAMSKRMG